MQLNREYQGFHGLFGHSGTKARERTNLPTPPKKTPLSQEETRIKYLALVAVSTLTPHKPG